MNAAVSCEGGERKGINTELWYACAGPLVSLPSAGSLVVYFPQGHSEQVAASMQKNADAHIPNYPNLPSKLICLLHNVTLHADPETDEVYAQMTLQPVNAKNKDALQASDHAPSTNRPQSEFFCKTLTASDTSTHGGFSVPRRAAEKIFPPLDFSMQPPVQELQAKDLHDNIWTFRHIYRGQPKRHLLTTGWSLFVSGKRLVAGDSVLFIRDEKSQLLLGIRRANKQVNNISSSVLSSDSMHIGVLAAAAHAAANNSLFTLFYNPRASPSEFVIPLAKYNKAIYGNHISLGMRFRMTFETEESGTRRYMGTITGISDSDPVRWKNSQWRNLQVGWDESAAGERRDRVSIWEIEPVVAPFFICPPPFFRTKLSRPLGDDESADAENFLKRPRPWFGDQISIKDSQSPSVVVPGMSLVQWMNMQQNQLLANTNMQPDYLSSITGTALQNLGPANISNQSSFQAQILQQNCMKINAHNRSHQTNQMTPISNMSVLSNQLGNVAMPQPPCDTFQQKHLVDQIYPFNQTHGSLGQTQLLVPAQVQQQQPLIQITQPPQTSLLQNQSSQFLLQQHHQKLLHQQQLQDQIPIQLCHQTNHPQLFEKELQLQQCQKLQQQPQPLPPQPILQNSQPTQEQQHLVKVSQCSPSSYSFPLQNTGSQQAANNTLVAMSLSHSSHKQTQKKPQQQLLEEVSEPTQEQKHLVHVSQGSSNSYSLPLQNSGLQQAVNNTSVATRLSHSMHNQTQKPQQQVLEEELPRMSHPVILHSSPQSSLPTAGVTQLEIFDDVPSCSRSPSTNVSALSQTIHNRSCTGPLATDEMPRSAVTPSPGMFEALIAIPNACKALQKNETKEKPLPVTSKMQSAGVFDPQAYLGSAPQMDFLDSSSSATSACLPQADGQLQENLPSPNKSSIFFRISASDDKIQAADPGNDIFGVNNGCTLDILPQTDCFISKNICPVNDCLNKLSSGNMLENYNSKEAQKALPKSYASQSFAVPDAAFSSIDSTINDCSFLNRSSRAPPQQKMRTYTKVYKRGAVGRSIDITRYSGYSELKEDLARMFGLGRELEDLQRIGWKLVYVDQENDVLLVGDDPWEEFVSCARCIRILSPQEVQQMSLDGDLDNNILPNQTCGSSDGGNMWRDQNPVNPSALPYDRFG